MGEFTVSTKIELIHSLQNKIILSTISVQKLWAKFRALTRSKVPLRGKTMNLISGVKAKRRTEQEQEEMESALIQTTHTHTHTHPHTQTSTHTAPKTGCLVSARRSRPQSTRCACWRSSRLATARLISECMACCVCVCVCVCLLRKRGEKKKEKKRKDKGKS